MSMLVLALSALAAAEHNAVEQEAMSLLQLAAQKRVAVDEETGPSAEWNARSNWGGKPFFLCENANPGSMSHCPPIEDKGVLEWAAQALNVRDCGIVSNRTGADTFNFDENKTCQPLKCDSVNVKAGPPQGAHNHTNMTIYSMYCGLDWVNQNFTSDVCGHGEPIYLGYHKYLKPPMKACDNTLNFSTMASNDLHKGGALVFSHVLPGIDVSIRANHFHWPQKDKTGLWHGFCMLNLKTGSNSTFTFHFHKHGTKESVTVDHFIVTMAELTTSKKCYNKMHVTATDYAGYYVRPNPQLDIKASAGNETSPPQVTFMSAHAEKGQPRNGTIKKKVHRETSASIYYRNTGSFTLKVETFDEMWKAGSSLRLGGQFMASCEEREVQVHIPRARADAIPSATTTQAL